MAQIDQPLYNTIAQAYALIDVALSGVQSNARTALDAIVDIDTLDYPTGSAPDADAALEIELALLTAFNSSYIAAGNISNSNTSLLGAVRAVNDFVIKESAGTDTATVKLDTWINSKMSGYWDGTSCPEGWANISSDAGYVTTDWVTE